MKQSIIYKILLFLSIVIIIISFVTNFLIKTNNKNLIDKIAKYNLNQTMESLNSRQKLELSEDKSKIVKELEIIAKHSSIFLYADDPEGLENNLILDLNQGGVKAIEIFDDVLEDIFLVGIKEKDSIYFTTEINNLENCIKFEKDIFQEEDGFREKIGSAILYYDESVIINKINRIRNEAILEIERFDIIIDNELKELNKLQRYIALISFLITLTTISILLIYFVNRPLNIVKDGLDNFFLFLQSKKNSVKNIEISSKDEFGKMAKSLNENIKVSAKLHKEIFQLNSTLELKVQKRTFDLEVSNKNIKDSIKFASLIQGALLPTDEVLENYTKDFFTFWRPKDVVGGDIYLITELKFKKEIVLMVIDGAGHGVPGAFVTMLVKAIETQVIADIEIGKLEPSPAKILEYFNKTIKIMLKQEKGSKSNAGFDGGVLYFNKDKNICKYAGAKTPLYIIQDGNLEVLKSDRKNIGFIRTKIDQTYTEYEIKVKSGMQIYLCTDGIIDQEGEDNSRYGKTRFEKLILQSSKQAFFEQKNILVSDFERFKSDFEQSDDITVVGMKF